MCEMHFKALWLAFWRREMVWDGKGGAKSSKAIFAMIMNHGLQSWDLSKRTRKVHQSFKI